MTGLHPRYYTSERAAKAGARKRLREDMREHFKESEIRRDCRDLFKPNQGGFCERVTLPSDPAALCAMLNDIADENP